MGQAIVYCAGCNAQLRDHDFLKGAAFRIEHKVVCRSCLPAGFVPPAKDRVPPGKRHGVTTTSGLRAVRAEVPKSAPVLAWAAGLSIGTILLLVAIVLWSSSGRPAAPPGSEAPQAEPRPAAPPAAETVAREALARLQGRIADSPADLDGQQVLFDEFSRCAPGTSIAPEVIREQERMNQRRRDRRTSEFVELDLQVRNTSADQAVILLKAARNRHAESAWTEAIDRRLSAIEPKPDPPPAADPAPQPAAPDAQPKPAPPAAPVFPPDWEAAMRLATTRDYASAQAALEKSPDLALVKAVATLLQDSLQTLLKTPRGRRLTLGAVEGSFQRESGGILELKTDAGLVELESGDIAAAALIAVARTAGPVDPTTAAAWCLIEGDAAGARALAGAEALPPRFWAYADKVATAPTAPGRELYRAALASLAKPVTAADGVLRLQALLRDRPEDLFVRRNLAAITTRSQGGRDFLFTAEDLHASGLFRARKSGKLETCWTCEADVEPARQKDTYLELDFSTLADTPYKAWIWAGACCLEVFEFSCQGTEMEAGKTTKEAAEPGAGAAILIKPYVSSLKKTHSQHNGPKQPARWEWVAIPLPRYARPGAQRIRILSDQKGFSVAAVVVSATRSGPPTEGELKELLRVRSERPRMAPPQPRVVSIYACAFDGTDQRLVGELREKSLHGVPMYEQCFLGLERDQPFIMPEQGELRFTYFLKSASQITARLRMSREGITIPCDVEVPSPVVGTPTEVRISFSDFKPAYGQKGPNVGPGEKTAMIYIFSPDLTCGLRLDALSLVEIRK